VRKCACSCRGQRPDHRQAVNTMSMAAIFTTQSHPILRFVGHSRSLPGKQTASNHEPSKCCRQVKHFIPIFSEDMLMQYTSTQSYGLAERLLSQAAMMVMAVSWNTRLRVHVAYIILCRLFMNQAQMESRSEPFRRVFLHFFSRLICGPDLVHWARARCNSLYCALSI
jgi:hypothetical protein